MKKAEKSPSAIDMYLNEISKIPLLTKEQEMEIAKNIVRYRKKLNGVERKLKKYKTKAKPKTLLSQFKYNKHKFELYTNKMIQGNYRLVVSVAKKYYNSFLQLTDLIEEGNIGLIKAVSRFNPYRGYRFSTFAIWWIRQSIVKSIRDKGKIVKIPIYVEKTMTKFKQVVNDYKKENGVSPNMEKMQEMMKLNPKKIHSLSNIPENFVSLNLKIGDSDKEIGEMLIDETSYFNPVDKTITDSLEGTLSSLMNNLNDREKQIINMRYGLNNNEPMVLDKIGKFLGITRERVRQIHAGALRKMREFGVKKDLEIFLN